MNPRIAIDTRHSSTSATGQKASTLDAMSNAQQTATTAWLSAVNTVSEWLRRSRGRAELARLSERQRCDIGLDSEAIEREIRKPFWRAHEVQREDGHVLAGECR